MITNSNTDLADYTDFHGFSSLPAYNLLREREREHIAFFLIIHTTEILFPTIFRFFFSFHHTRRIGKICNINSIVRRVYAVRNPKSFSEISQIEDKKYGYTKENPGALKNSGLG